MLKFSRSIFGKNLLFSFFSILVVGIASILISYSLQGKLLQRTLMEQAQGVATLWESTFDHAQIEQAFYKADLNSNVQKSLTEQLSQLSDKHSKIAQGYIISPGVSESGDVTLIATPKHLQEAGMPPGTKYKPSPFFNAALEKLVKNGKPTSTGIYTDELGTWETALIPVFNNDGTVLAVFGIDLDASMMTIAKKEIIISLVTAIGLLLIFICVIQYFSLRKILSPFKFIISTIDKVSKGNLNVHIDVKSKDEFGQLGQMMNTMISSLRELLSQVSLVSNKVNESSINFRTIANDTAQTSATLSKSIEDISERLQTQMQGSLESAQAMEEMAIGIQKAAESSTQVSESSEDTLTATQRGNEFIQKAINQMSSISHKVGDTATVITSLGERSQEIGNIISVISSISEQTNLLALNAAIEAARAGEQGKGFAVVADEVRKLAEQSQTSAAQISNLIQVIQSETAQAVKAMNEGLIEVRNGEEVINNVGTVFHEIVNSTKNVTEQVQEVSAIFEQMSASSQEVSASVTETTDIAKASVGTIKELSDDSIKQIHSMRELKAASENLSLMIKELETQMSKFEI